VRDVRSSAAVRPSPRPNRDQQRAADGEDESLKVDRLAPRRQRASVAPIAVTMMPTVFTSHRSRFGPVTAMKLRMCTIGQRPVSAKYTAWTKAVSRSTR
jgi:hypothetical protein